MIEKRSKERSFFPLFFRMEQQQRCYIGDRPGLFFFPVPPSPSWRFNILRFSTLVSSVLPQCRRPLVLLVTVVIGIPTSLAVYSRKENSAAVLEK